jgi:hypothetical protein
LGYIAQQPRWYILENKMKAIVVKLEDEVFQDLRIWMKQQQYYGELYGVGRIFLDIMINAIDKEEESIYLERRK